MTKAILEKWLVAQKRHRLSDRQVQMARELGLNPDKLGKIDNHRQEVWKTPLPQFNRGYLLQAVQTGRAGNGQALKADYG